MAIVFETDNFQVTAPEKPHIDRDDGGHLRIAPKIPIEDRTKLSPRLACECMKLTMVCGEAMAIVMPKRGVDIGRINYQDNGNWLPTFHIHVYGRARTAKTQKFGDAMILPQRSTGFYDTFGPLTEEDVRALHEEIQRLWKSEKYRTFM